MSRLVEFALNAVDVESDGEFVHIRFRTGNDQLAMLIYVAVIRAIADQERASYGAAN